MIDHEPKWLCVFLIDVSASMGKESLMKLNKELEDFYRLIKGDDTSRKRFELCITTFGQGIQTLQKPSLVDSFTMPILDAENIEVLVNAVNDVVERIKLRKRWYKETNQSYYRPCLVLVTNVANDKLYQSDAFARIREDVSAKEYVFLNIGMNGSSVLARQGNVLTNLKDKRSLSQMLFPLFQSVRMTIDKSKDDCAGDDLLLGLVDFEI